MQSSQDSRPLRVLAIDDADGARVFAQIEVIEILMKKLHERQQRLDTASGTSLAKEDFRPCNQFDLIVGAGTGGILASLFGRFRLSPEACRDASKRLGRDAYSKSCWGELVGGLFTILNRIFGMRNVSALELVVDNLVETHLITESDGNLDGNESKVFFMNQRKNDQQCRTAVATSYTASICPRECLLRSYESTKGGDSTFTQVTVSQALQATVATPGKFPPIVIGGKYGPGLRLRGAAWGFSNPASVAVTEAETLFPGRRIHLFSIGAGEKKIFKLFDGWNTVKDLWRKEKNLFGPPALALLTACAATRALWRRDIASYGFTPLALLAAWWTARVWWDKAPFLRVLHENFATNTEAVHNEMSKKLKGSRPTLDAYFRFQPEGDVFAMRNDDWTEENLGNIQDLANRFMEQQKMKPLINSAIGAMVVRKGRDSIHQ